MEDKLRETQKYLNDDFRKENPEIASYSDEEIAMMNPATKEDIASFNYISANVTRNSSYEDFLDEEDRIAAIDEEIRELTEEIELNNARIANPMTYYQEITETRSENARLESRRLALLQERENILKNRKEDFGGSGR